MKPKVYYNGRRINGRFDSLKAAVRRFVRWVLKWTLISGAVVSLAAVLGAVYFSHSTVTYAEKEVRVPVAVQAPILDRIADAESGGCKAGGRHQFQADGVTPVMHVNNNGTVDVGEWQINQNASNITIQAKQGFNVLTQEGNEAMAKWLYANVGTGPWSSSQHCWGR